MTAVGASGSLSSTSATIEVRDLATPNFSHSYQSTSAANTNPAVLVKGGRGVLSLNPLTGKTKQIASVAGARAIAFGGPEQTRSAFPDGGRRAA